MNKISISQQIETDVLIVGGGIAGLSCCVEAKQHGLKHLLISKAPIGSGASFFPLKATLGIQVTGDATDIPLFRQDIERVAGGMNNPKIVKAYVEESSQAIDLLAKIGFRAWKRNDNRPACFAHYARPIYLINDWKNTAERAKHIITQQSTQYFENATLLYIATVQNQVQGAIFSVETSGQISYIFCKTSQIILATGGIAGLYKDNLYPADIIGSSHHIALQAGASLTNLEFIQFIPAFVSPKYKVLFGEHTLKYCTGITDTQGNNLFADYSLAQFSKMVVERSDYAPFSSDFACKSFDLTIMRYLSQTPQAQGVYLRYSPALYQDKEEFYQVYLDWLEKDVGINLLRDPIAIAPFAHSCNGGIEIDEYAQSQVAGLFAVGEVSACIEGANRLGGNSVGGSLVFAKRAIQRILQNLAENRPLVSAEQAIQQGLAYFNSLANPHASRQYSASQLLCQIRTKMSQFANVYRTEQQLNQLFDELVNLEQNYCPLQYLTHYGIEIYHALQTAKWLVKSMIARQESRGAHFRADYPNRSTQPYRLVINKTQGVQKVCIFDEKD